MSVLIEEKWRRWESNPRKVSPEHQTRRGRSGCTCGGPCFWCGEDLPGPHEHDHFPLAYRHGGRTTVPSCRRCHSLKDRVGFHRWAPAALQSAADGLGAVAGMALAMLAEKAKGDSDMSMGDDRDDLAGMVERLVDDCSTAEARIALAAMVNKALDAEKREATEGEAGRYA